MNRKKELKEQYRQMKQDMGLLIIRTNFNNKCYIEGTQNLRATINSTKFKLELGAHPNRELQKEWKKYGEGSFTIGVLDNLEYEKDESKTDYKDDLTLLQMKWEEKMAEDGIDFFKK